MSARILDEVIHIVNAHRDYDLFMWESLDSHIKTQFGFAIATDDLLIFFVLKAW